MRILIEGGVGFDIQGGAAIGERSGGGGGGEDEGEIAWILVSEEGIGVRVTVDGIVRVIRGGGGGREVEKCFAGASGGGGEKQREEEEERERGDRHFHAFLLERES